MTDELAAHPTSIRLIYYLGKMEEKNFSLPYSFKFV